MAQAAQLVGTTRDLSTVAYGIVSGATIFSLHGDEDIRHALDDLPKGLAETFQRALRRIEDGHHGPAARKIFPWVAASKRPLSLGELR